VKIDRNWFHIVILSDDRNLDYPGNMAKIKDSTMLITGAASGIGAASARLFKELGANLILVDINEEPLKDLGKDLAAQTVKGDVGSLEDWDKIKSFVTDNASGLDLVYLNAGIASGISDIAQLTPEAYRRIMATNLDGVIFGVSKLLDLLEASAKSNGGSSICITASMAGLIGFPPDPIYTVTKHGLVGFVRSLDSYMSLKNITINAVCPGIVDTPLITGEARKLLKSVDFPLIPPSQIAEAVRYCIESGLNGQCVICQIGLDPTPFKFGGIPGPRGEGIIGATPPL
jgi:NAD(P)-dependent dehydrogenase (short-subunit alcohol dehydrogenase family)